MREHLFLFSLTLYILTPLYRETVSADFMAACQFLKDHMDNMDNPNDDMVSSLDSSLGFIFCSWLLVEQVYIL